MDDNNVVPDLNFPRVNHNAVILMDGSIGVIGGSAGDDVACISRLIPELYKPPELFGNANAYWKPMAEQTVDRRYHSVAGLLRDGRVYSAGGKNVADDCADPEDPDCASDHSVEIYSPPYMIRGARPVIQAETVRDPTDPAEGPYEYGEVIEFDVTLPPNTLVGRVALIRNGVATHAFDSNQRYVQLAWTIPPENLGNNRWKVRALSPEDGYRAPPGYYFLTVVSSTQMPSLGVWVRIDQP